MRKLLLFAAYIYLFPSSALRLGAPSTPTPIVKMNTSTPGTTLTGTIGDAGTVCGGNCTVGTNLSLNTLTMCFDVLYGRLIPERWIESRAYTVDRRRALYPHNR